jgi:class 3 adenylate cyclase
LLCPSCQRLNPEGARFCNGCGGPLSGICPSCHHVNPAEAAFCNACGSSLGGSAAESPAQDPRAYTPSHLAERILHSRSALEGERKHVTVLFCDLADSTRIAERLGADTMHEIMDRCFALILDQVHRYEGTVNQFLGDGVMALFGAPLALEDAPHRAVTAALAIHRALEPLGDELRRRFGIEFEMRIGIHSGPVVVGSIGDDLRMDYTAVGDTTNLASRLQGLARPGMVLVSDATASLIQGWFDLECLGDLEVKGRWASGRYSSACRPARPPGSRPWWVAGRSSRPWSVPTSPRPMATARWSSWWEMQA